MSELWQVYQKTNQICFNKNLLECSVCNNFLSPPIYITADNGNICKACKKKQSQQEEAKKKKKKQRRGRRSKVNTIVQTMRNEPLEAALADTRVPCKYYAKGCHVLRNGDAMDHQLYCNYAPLKCPICKVDVPLPISDVFKHCQHSCAYMQLPNSSCFELNQLYANEGVKIQLVEVIANRQRYYIKIQQEDADSFCINICNPSNMHKHQNVVLRIISNGFEIRVPVRIGESFNLLTTTDANYVKTIYLPRQQATNDTAAKVDLELLFNDGLKSLPLKDESNFRKDIECTICMHLLKDVYKCKNSHNVCGSCKERIDTCPICRIDFGDTIDVKMENLLAQLVMPCINKDHGCLFEANLSLLDVHEMNCYYHQYECNMECCSVELCQEGLIKHYTDEHDLKQNGCTINMDINEVTQENILYLNNIFLLAGVKRDNDYVWKLTLVNSTDNPSSFAYDISIFGNNGEILLSLSNSCGNELFAELNFITKILMPQNFTVKCFIRKIYDSKQL